MSARGSQKFTATGACGHADVEWESVCGMNDRPEYSFTCPECPTTFPARAVSLIRAHPLVAAPLPVATTSTPGDGYGWLRGGANTVREAYAAFMGRA